MVDSGDAAAP